MRRISKRDRKVLPASVEWTRAAGSGPRERAQEEVSQGNGGVGKRLGAATRGVVG